MKQFITPPGGVLMPSRSTTPPPSPTTATSRRQLLSGSGVAALGITTVLLPMASAAASEYGSTPLTAAGTMDAPTGLTATAGDTTVSLSWTAVAEAVEYQVQYRESDPPGTWMADEIVATTSSSVTGLINDVTYEFRVVATDGTTENVSDPSTSATATPALSAPGTPEGLSVAPSTPGAVTATWSTGAGSAAATYSIRYSTTDGSGWTQVDDIAATTATISSLDNGTTYYVQVLATNAAGSSSWTDSVSVVPIASAETTVEDRAPGPPVVAVVTAPTAVTITTDKDVAGNEARLYAYATDGTTFTSATVTTEDPTFAVPDLSGGETITVRKYESDGTTLVGTSLVEVTARTASYAAGQVYTFTNASASSATRIGTLTATLIGGSGGRGGSDGNDSGGSPEQPGRLVATVTLGAGEAITLAAGSGGASGSTGSGGTGGSGGSNAFGGYAGGTGGGAGPYGVSGRGGGGGAASVVKVEGTVVAVAGGAGGGGGAEDNTGAGGAGSTTTGGAGGTSGGSGRRRTGSGDDSGGGGGGGGGAVGGSGGLDAFGSTFSYDCAWWGGNCSTGSRYRGLGGRQGTNAVDGAIAVATSDGRATGRNISEAGAIALEYLEVTSLTQVS